MNLLPFVESLSDTQKDIVIYLHELIKGNPNIVAKIRYKVPFYFIKTWFAYINPSKKDKSSVELCFLRAREFDFFHPIIDFRDRKLVGGIMIDSYDDLFVKEEVILKALKEATTLENS